MRFGPVPVGLHLKLMHGNANDIQSHATTEVKV
jgi:hypothetical protein